MYAARVDLQVSLAGRGDLAARIYRQLLDAILDGRLRAGERLPPTRELARRLEVSRNTVATAYDRLTAEGFLVGKVGAGTFVSTAPVTRLRSRSAPAGGVRPRASWRAAAPVMPTRVDDPGYDFRVGMPDPRLFPLETWRRLVARELKPSALRSAAYADPGGRPDLRAAIARYVGVSRSVRTGADDVVVTNGAQQGLDLVGRVLIEPGAVVAVEEPGYPPARAVFESLGARVVGVPVDSDGLDVTALPRAAALVYVTPSHQFPMGIPMSLARRTALLEWAEWAGAVVVEDDYDSEFRFSDRPLEPLQSLDTAGRVVYVGSFSKTLLPGLRLGFLVPPASLRSALRAAKQLSDWHAEQTNQAALARLMDEGLLARHIRKAGREYAARHDLIVSRLASDFGAWLTVVPSAAGLHVAARARPGIDVDAVVERAARLDVTVESLARYCAAGPQRGLVIGYGLASQSHIPEGLTRLLKAFRSP
jgi:GntR family transcriptional regulator / MocR family aminotransferase